MHDLGLEEKSFDLIWSEGALYILGFRNGLEICYPLLVPGGVMAITELSWLKPDPPEECRQLGYHKDGEKLAVVESVQKEIDLYNKYFEYYGYVFYVMQRKY